MVSVTNHEVHGFSNSFQHIKSIKKLQTDWPNTFLPTTGERGFEEMFFGRIPKATVVHYLTPKKAHINESVFFKIHIPYLF